MADIYSVNDIKLKDGNQMTNAELCDVSSGLLMAVYRKLPARELVAVLTEGIVMTSSYRAIVY